MARLVGAIELSDSPSTHGTDRHLGQPIAAFIQ